MENEVREGWVKREDAFDLYDYQAMPEDVSLYVHNSLSGGGWAFAMRSLTSGKERWLSVRWRYSTRLVAMIDAESIVNNPDWLAMWLDEVRGGKLL